MLGPHSTCCAPILLLLCPYSVVVPYIVIVVDLHDYCCVGPNYSFTPLDSYLY